MGRGYNASFLRHLARCPVNPRAIIDSNLGDVEDMAQGEPKLAAFSPAGAIGDDGFGRVNAQRFQPCHQGFFVPPSQHPLTFQVFPQKGVASRRDVTDSKSFWVASVQQLHPAFSDSAPDG